MPSCPAWNLGAWYQRTSARTGNGEWGVAVGTMDGRILWSASPELELVPGLLVRGSVDARPCFAGRNPGAQPGVAKAANPANLPEPPD